MKKYDKNKMIDDLVHEFIESATLIIKNEEEKLGKEFKANELFGIVMTAVANFISIHFETFFKKQTPLDHKILALEDFMEFTKSIVSNRLK